MTDPTTARDRAIEVLAGVIGYDERDGEPHALTGEIVDALLAHPEVLRALAAAPTADVATTEWGAKWSDAGYCPSSPPRSEEFARQHARNFGTRPIRRSVGPWLYDDTGGFVFADERDRCAAAPEGAPTADVAHFRDCIGDIADSYIPDPARRAELINDVMTTAREVLLAAAPEGVDAADDLTRVHAELTEYGNKYAAAARELDGLRAAPDDQPAPAGGDEPREAETRLRGAAAERGPGDAGGGWVRVVLADDLRAVLRELKRLRRALAGHLFDGESLSTREALRSELIEQGLKDSAELERLRAMLGEDA